MNADYSILAHPADVGLRARGPDLSGALDRAVAALACIELGTPPPPPTERRALRVEADDDEGLTVALLEECLFHLDADDWLAVGAALRRAPGALEGELLGGPFDPALAADGVHVKAITWHELSILHDADGVTLTLYVDI